MIEIVVEVDWTLKKERMYLVYVTKGLAKIEVIKASFGVVRNTCGLNTCSS